MAIGRSIRGYLELCRISNLPSVWTNVLCASILAGGRFSWEEYLLPALSLSCFYLGGMCLNDVCDAEFDMIRCPSRPIPSARVSRQGALLLTIILFAAGFAVLSEAQYRQAFLAALLLVAAIVCYDLRHKQNPFSVLLMASCRILVFVVAALAVSGRIAAAVLIAGCVQFAYVIAISLVARYENSRTTPFIFPVIPLMLAGISLLDGIMLALLVEPVWLLAGACGALLMHAGQRFVRGD